MSHACFYFYFLIIWKLLYKCLPFRSPHGFGISINNSGVWEDSLSVASACCKIGTFYPMHVAVLHIPHIYRITSTVDI